MMHYFLFQEYILEIDQVQKIFMVTIEVVTKKLETFQCQNENHLRL